MSSTSIRPSISSRKGLSASLQHDENAIHPTRTLPLDQSQSKSSLIPTSASFVRTRSMTRLSSVLDENKLSHIDKISGKVPRPQEQAKEKKVLGAGSGLAVRRPLGAKMQAQMSAGGGMKRRLGSPGMPKKRIKVDEGRKKMLVLADKEEENEQAPPRTPERPQRAPVQAQPTPARDILGAGPALKEEDEDDDEDSPEVASRFIARPPTPPRPHIHLRQSPIRAKPLVAATRPSPSYRMDLDSPDRYSPSAAVAVTPTRLSSASTSSIPRAAPQTPRTTQTPRRVMGSVSRFRAAPSSRNIASPAESSSSAGNVLASILATADTVHTVATSSANDATVHPEIVDAGDQPAVKAEASLTQLDDFDHLASMPELPEDAAGMTTFTSAEQPQAAIEGKTAASASAAPSPSRPALFQSTLSFSPAQSTVANSSSSAMPPPSRIPRAISKLSLSSSTVPTQPLDRPKMSSLPMSAKPSLSSLGRGLPSTTSSTSLTAGSSSEPVPVRRKPSYPSTLGSGPLNRPRDRMVSGPTLYPQRDGTLATSKGESSIPKGRQSPRSVSEPAPRAQPRVDLSASTSRREGMSMETSKSMAGLSDALNKLKIRRSESLSEPNRSRPSMCSTIAAPAGKGSSAGPSSFKQPMLPPAASTSRLSNVHRPRHSIAPLTTASADTSMTAEEEQAGDRSLAAILSTATETKCFKGVVAFVDVRTTDGEDASPIFVEMLKSLGARVLTRPTENVTHIVYKSGRPTTLAWYRKQDEDERPKVVGISWVTRSKEKGEKLDEEAFLVDVSEEDIFQKRRKSMEPKALMAHSAAAPRQSLLTDASLNVASIRRKSLLYAPKVSSPLKRCTVLRDE